MGSRKKTFNSGQVPFQFVTTMPALRAAAKTLAADTRIGVDLEADSMYHYQEKVCLLQLATRDQYYVIDPLVLDNLDPLQPLFTRKDIQKIFHGSDYDVRSLFRDFKIAVNNLFDTQLASRFLGIRETSLDAVVQARFAAKLDKRFQRKDWSRRPLPSKMVAYAVQDAVYLIELAEQLEAELNAKQRLRWVQEECRALSQVRPPSSNDHPLFLSCKGAGRFGPRGLGVLEALLQYRDSVARQKDRPLFKVIGNKPLLQLAARKPSNLNQMKKLNALSSKQIKWYGPALIAVIKDAMQLPESELPVYPRHKAPVLPPKVPDRIRALRKWRDKKAAELKIDPTLLLTKAMLASLAIAKPLSQKKLIQIEEINHWRREVLGPDIVRILKKTP
jgi:ribonuclease D